MTLNYLEGEQLRRLTFGLKVDRATATLPQTTAAAIFNVLVGRVAMLGIVGEVTTVLGAVGNMSLEVNPTVGTTTAICAVVAAGTAEASSQFSIEGTAGTAMTLGAGGAVAMQVKPVVLSVGTLDLRLSGSSTGSVKWSILYVPIDDGAYVTAA